MKQKYYTGHNLVVQSNLHNICPLRNRETTQQWKKRILTCIHFVHPVGMSNRVRRGIDFTDKQNSDL